MDISYNKYLSFQFCYLDPITVSNSKPLKQDSANALEELITPPHSLQSINGSRFRYNEVLESPLITPKIPILIRITKCNDSKEYLIKTKSIWGNAVLLW